MLQYTGQNLQSVHILYLSISCYKNDHIILPLLVFHMQTVAPCSYSFLCFSKMHPSLPNTSSVTCFITAVRCCCFPFSPHFLLLTWWFSASLVPSSANQQQKNYPPPSPLPAPLHIPTVTTISTRLPTNSQTGLCPWGWERNSRDLCHSMKLLENIRSAIKLSPSPSKSRK